MQFSINHSVCNGVFMKGLVRAFWQCGDSEIINYAIMRARLNKREKQVLTLMLDECNSQEKTAEIMDVSTRQVQYIWHSAESKLLSIEWVKVYAKYLKEQM